MVVLCAYLLGLAWFLGEMAILGPFSIWLMWHELTDYDDGQTLYKTSFDVLAWGLAPVTFMLIRLFT